MLKYLITVVLLVALANAVVDARSKYDIETHGYSWVVRIEENGDFRCGGILLERKKVICPSGCINGEKLQDYELVFGYENGDVSTNGIKRIDERKDIGIIFITPKGKVDIPDEDIRRLPRIANEEKDEKASDRTCVLTGFADDGDIIKNRADPTIIRIQSNLFMKTTP